MTEPTPLLSIRDLRTYFYTSAGVARSVDGVSLDVYPRETVGVVGESGCGKSVTALSVLRLIRPPGRIEPGSRIALEGRDIMAMDDAELRAVRGNRIAMIFQEPMTALNPVFTVGDQIAEVARVHAGDSRKAAWARAVEMLELMGIPSPAERATLRTSLNATASTWADNWSVYRLPQHEALIGRTRAPLRTPSRRANRRPFRCRSRIS